MSMSGTLSRGAAAAALAAGLLASAPSANAERFDLSRNVVFNLDCPGSSVNCDTTLHTLGLSDDPALSANDANDASSPLPANSSQSPSTETLTAIPEPSTWALLLVWFGGLAYAGLRRQRRKERFAL